MILSLLVLLSTLEGTPESVTGPYSQEELAGGAIREIISAQAYHRKAFPALGFCVQHRPAGGGAGPGERLADRQEGGRLQFRGVVPGSHDAAGHLSGLGRSNEEDEGGHAHGVRG